MSVLVSVAKKLAESRQKIKAFHGSPHDFDKFSTENIGTGEGAQAYGHGLYFAEREGTAKAYRDNLKGNIVTRNDGVQKTYGQHITDVENAIKAEHPNLHSDNVNRAAKSVIDDNLTLADIEGMGEFENVYKTGINANKSARESKGSMYEVDIDASPDELLDYDLPLNTQSPKIQKSIDDIMKSMGVESYVRDGGDGAETIYIGTGLGGLNTGSEILNNLSGKRGPLGASQMLKEAGVKGIKYADAQTRFSPKGRTNNYVMFDDETIEIARKYGVAMPVAAAILAGTITPEQAEAGVVTKAAKESMLKFFDEAEVDNAIRQAGNRKSREALTQMPIDDFLSLARDGYDPAKSAGISNVSKFDDLPFLNIRSEDGIANITGHEGRHRARRLKELGESTMPVRIKSDIRWDQQNDPKLWDYEQDYPQILFNEDGTKKSPFPFVQGDSNLLDSSALNIEDIQRKTTPTAKQIDDDELLKGLFGSSAATAVGAGALFSPGDAHANLMDEDEKLRAMGSKAWGKVSPELAAYRRAQILPDMATLAQGAVRDTAKGLDYLSPANLTRLLLDPADEGLSRFISPPISNMKSEAAKFVTQPMLYDEDDQYSKERKRKTMDIGGMLFSPI